MSKPEPESLLRGYQERLRTGAVSKEDLRAERDTILDLYKHHLRLLLETNVFLFAVTGALLSFVVAHIGMPHIRWVLFFPVVFDGMFAIFLLLAGRGIDFSEAELQLISRALGVNTFPFLDALKLGLRVSAVALLIAALLIACTVLFIHS
jgi:hypothetical protein